MLGRALVSPRKTRRQEIIERLLTEQWAFDDLRHDLGLTVRVLEEDLKHIQKSVRTAGDRLQLRSASCVGCGFEFTANALHPPGRCPSCHDRRIEGPWLKITS
jgi:predicted Zn-ribbon and HTH transcriptional regulator